MTAHGLMSGKTLRNTTAGSRLKTMTQDQATRATVEIFLKALIKKYESYEPTTETERIDSNILLKDLELALLAIQGNLNVDSKTSKVFSRENPRLFSSAPIIEVDELPF